MGGPYFTLEELIDLLQNPGYLMLDIKVLNIRPFKNLLLTIFGKIANRPLLYLTNKSHTLKKVIGGQTLFIMKKI